MAPALVGWDLAALFIAGFTGIVRRDLALGQADLRVDPGVFDAGGSSTGSSPTRPARRHRPDVVSGRSTSMYSR